MVDGLMNELQPIMQAVSAAYGIPVEVLLGGRGKREVSDARAVFCYIAYKHTVQGIAQIAEYISRDPSSVSSAVRKAEGMIQISEQHQRVLTSILEKMGSRQTEQTDFNASVTAGYVFALIHETLSAIDKCRVQLMELERNLAEAGDAQGCGTIRKRSS